MPLLGQTCMVLCMRVGYIVLPRDKSVRLASFGSGWQVPFILGHLTLVLTIYTVSIMWGRQGEGKWDDQMRWPDVSCLHARCVMFTCKIGKLRRFLDQANTERLVHAFVTTHLDYCNSLYVNLPQTHIAPLQRIQNTAARLVSRTKKSDHITPVLRSLHWLPMVQRIQFKVLTITYKVKHGLAPKYISELLVPKNPSRVLRSSSSIHLQFSPGPIPRTRYGSRAFAVAAPQLWNKLPLHIRSSPSLDTFKTLLKTHLMRSM